MAYSGTLYRSDGEPQWLKLCVGSPLSHKSSSIQKETPKKKPKLEMKPSNGDRYERSFNHM